LTKIVALCTINAPAKYFEYVCMKYTDDLLHIVVFHSS
jgi:hypothetical protein